MKERPIIFGAESVKAILEGRKTMTRRVIKPQPGSHWSIPPARYDGEFFNRFGLARGAESIRCPCGQRGDRLWVKEAFSTGGEGTLRHTKHLLYAASLPLPAKNLYNLKWRSPIFMPHWASRILLEIIDLRVQRVKEITNDDAIAEGCPDTHRCTPEHDDYFGLYPIDEFPKIWDSLNAKRGYGWNANPWVWAISFKRIEEGRKP